MPPARQARIKRSHNQMPFAFGLPTNEDRGHDVAVVVPSGSPGSLRPGLRYHAKQRATDFPETLEPYAS